MQYKKFLKFLSLALFLLIQLGANAAHSQDNKITVGGSSTVYNYIFNNKKHMWNERVGFEFETIVSSSGRGVLGLIEGRNDIAAISSDFSAILEKLSNTQGVTVNADDYVVYPISQTKVLFIVNPANPIKEMTRQQVKDIFTGKVRNWDALGVPGLGEIKVVAEHETGGIFNTVLQKVTDKEPILEDRITMQNGPQTAIVVSQLRNSFGMLSAATPEPQRRNVAVLETGDFEAVQNMYFVTKKDNTTPEMLKIIETIQAEIQ